eukprot:9127177-Pyramimonas_sp.AAC.1
MLTCASVSVASSRRAKCRVNPLHFCPSVSSAFPVASAKHGVVCVVAAFSWRLVGIVARPMRVAKLRCARAYGGSAGSCWVVLLWGRRSLAHIKWPLMFWLLLGNAARLACSAS